MTDVQQKAAAKQFVKTWTGRGNEKQDTQTFWLTFLRDVFGVTKPEDVIKFEAPVKLDHTSFIDAYMENTHVLIEQKGLGMLHHYSSAVRFLSRSSALCVVSSPCGVDTSCF